jgi:hypothetical protein
MSDNMTQSYSGKQRKGLLRKILAISVTLLVVLGVLALILFPQELNLDAMRRWFRYLNVRGDSTYGEYVFDSHNSNRFASLEDGLAIASVGGLYGYGPDGTELIAEQAQLGLPVLRAEGPYAMAYDAGGNTLLAIHYDRGEVLRLTDLGTLYDADLSSDGSVCYAASGTGHKTVLAVYDEQQKMIYRWFSASYYMPVCAVSKGAAQIAAIGLGQQDNTFLSSLYLFDTASDQPKLNVALGNELIYDLQFCADDLLCAVGEASVWYIKTNGEIVANYSYNGQYLKDHEAGGDGFLALMLNMYRAGNRYTIETVDLSGQQIASLYVGTEILDISASGRYVAVLTSSNLTIYNEKLEVYSSTLETGTATAVVMREDGTALLLGNGSGKLYIP